MREPAQKMGGSATSRRQEKLSKGTSLAMMKFGFKIVAPKRTASSERNPLLEQKNNQKNHFRALFNPEKLMKNIGLPVITC